MKITIYSDTEHRHNGFGQYYKLELNISDGNSCVITNLDTDTNKHIYDGCICKCYIYGHGCKMLNTNENQYNKYMFDILKSISTDYDITDKIFSQEITVKYSIPPMDKFNIHPFEHIMCIGEYKKFTYKKYDNDEIVFYLYGFDKLKCSFYDNFINNLYNKTFNVTDCIDDYFKCFTHVMFGTSNLVYKNYFYEKTYNLMKINIYDEYRVNNRRHINILQNIQLLNNDICKNILNNHLLTNKNVFNDDTNIICTVFHLIIKNYFITQMTQIKLKSRMILQKLTDCKIVKNDDDNNNKINKNADKIDCNNDYVIIDK